MRPPLREAGRIHRTRPDAASCLERSVLHFCRIGARDLTKLSRLVDSSPRVTPPSDIDVGDSSDADNLVAMLIAPREIAKKNDDRSPPPAGPAFAVAPHMRPGT